MKRGKAWKGCAAGIAGGLAATLVMTGFQSAWNAAMAKSSGTTAGNGSESDSSKGNGHSNQQKQSQHSAEDQNPTTKVADKIVGIAGAELSPEGKKTGGTVVHYAFGTLMGAVYGTALEFAPRSYRRKGIGTGLLMGTALFAGADEVALPVLGLTGNPTEIPASMHVYGLLSHLVYGATVGLVTRTARKAM